MEKDIVEGMEKINIDLPDIDNADSLEELMAKPSEEQEK